MPFIMMADRSGNDASLISSHPNPRMRTFLRSLQDQAIRVEEFSARSGAVPRYQIASRRPGQLAQMNTVTPQNAVLMEQAAPASRPI
uniref:hypothetical protein n=1 Tax=Cupriavidus taiwanensis TaxID=164546 RepID=UPI001E34E471